jgi:tRNA 5-methylaminomethyl-2-thiouridine biosynthesis bifunctional protein
MQLDAIYTYPPALSQARSAIVIGGGVAGCFAGYFLHKAGFQVKLLERNDSIANEASGNAAGIIYPRLEASWNPPTQFYLQAWQMLMATLAELEGLVDFHKVGMARLALTAKDQERFVKIAELVDRSSWLRYENAQQAEKLLGIPLNYDFLYTPESGYLSVPSLCRALTRDIEVVTGVEAQGLERVGQSWYVCTKNSNDVLSADVVVVANAFAASLLLGSEFFNLSRVRGQVNYLQPQDEGTAGLRAVLCHKGYVTPLREGRHHIGATYNHDDFSSELIAAESQANLAQLQQMLPEFQGEITGGRAAVRCYAKDKMPIIGPMPSLRQPGGAMDVAMAMENSGVVNAPGLFVSIAHGSRGILSACLGGHIIQRAIVGEAVVGDDVNKSIHPARFFARSLRAAGINKLPS